ncbi:RNA modification enzyme, MiaB family [Thermovirga lienii DSM 17291]|uniref:tRNA-2-methylthio-N(6)-dimethylallyladenosine synthase n=1 Tax=Thermovirga lienii (strain ATCC BAA-1197 / DSM 17291 / Cas60314) TaxID=580340 RepID=G7V604_THELD|nr:tRNA (N6-isopentenyl adenosine(37)-C2)-methylthiotransferase MiaB [Thermovirga lienii]AER66991.1 RNA modification enzyme, MiaB family [Thermovirga lienii DSM 17291]
MNSYAIKVYGCQMNVYDAERLRTAMAKEGFSEVSLEEKPELVIFVTCSIREKAEQKVWSEIGRLDSQWRRKGAPKVAVIGCMAQRLGSKFMDRFKSVCLVAGPRNLGKVPEALSNIAKNEERVLLLDDPRELSDLDCPPLRRDNPWRAYITIAHGCDNFCTYCIVPFTRGRFRSRAPEEIFKEIDFLVADGVREIILLGQNVNSYGADFDNGYRFSNLLRDVASDERVDLVRFLTSHPKDFTEDIVDVMASNSKICPAINLPIQSGSDRILSLMNRGYTVEQYAKIVETIRNKLEEVAITSDLIVGFPGETEEDFNASVDALKRFRFDLVHTAAYSPREGTAGAKMKDQLSEEEKYRRLNIVNELQNKISYEINASLKGKKYKVLLDSLPPKGEGLLQGRTPTDKVVLVEGDPGLLGKFVEVSITEAEHWCLRGKLEKIIG